jgi:hypothetical protein
MIGGILSWSDARLKYRLSVVSRHLVETDGWMASDSSRPMPLLFLLSVNEISCSRKMPNGRCTVLGKRAKRSARNQTQKICHVALSGTPLKAKPAGSGKQESAPNRSGQEKGNALRERDLFFFAGSHDISRSCGTAKHGAVSRCRASGRVGCGLSGSGRDR